MDQINAEQFENVVEIIKEKNDEAPLSGIPIDQIEKPTILTQFSISKMSNGAISWNFGGADSDILGLIEFGKSLIFERIRINAMTSIAENAAKMEAAIAAQNKSEV